MRAVRASRSGLPGLGAPPAPDLHLRGALRLTARGGHGRDLRAGARGTYLSPREAACARGTPPSSWLGGSVTDLLATNLGRATGVRVISTARMYDILRRVGNGRDSSSGAFAAAAQQAGTDRLRGSWIRYRRGRVMGTAGSTSRAGLSPLSACSRALDEPPPPRPAGTFGRCAHAASLH